MEESEGFEYVNKDLRNINFDEQELSGTNFSGSNLEGATFRNSILRDADFNSENIRGCDFSGAILSKANFENAQSGIIKKRFSELLLAAFEVAAFPMPPGTEGGGDFNVYNSTNPGQSAGIPLAAAMYSLAGSILFLSSGYRLSKSSEEAFILPNIALSLVLLIVCFLALKAFVSLLQQSSSTSFQNSDLSGANFNNVVLENINFSGSTQDDVS
jgi:uncharacterized protein YjbI with pentapeptide repeats